ncbi:MAG: hypothetical protein ABIJ91_05495 [Candidatus Kuenenbacteria bacterium]
MKHISFQDFIHRNGKPTDVVICPTYAIDITNNSVIQKRCVSCGLCWHKAKDFFVFDGKYDKRKFIEFCNKGKMFVYSWLSLVLKEYSGIDVVCVGYSRTKRIPLLVLENDILYIIKASHEVGDLEKTYREIEDIQTLLNKEIENLKIKKITLLINNLEQKIKFTAQFGDCLCLSLEKVLENFLIKGYYSILEHIKFSRC